jgi:hypothetical protein
VQRLTPVVSNRDAPNTVRSQCGHNIAIEPPQSAVNHCDVDLRGRRNGTQLNNVPAAPDDRGSPTQLTDGLYDG